MKTEMTKQEVFDKVAKHLLTQNEQAIANGRCLYRAPGGLKCAVGCLIDDEFYTPYFEGEALDLSCVTIVDCVLYDALVSSGVSEDVLDSQLLVELQGVHDRRPPRLWPDKLREVASEFKLSTSVLDKEVGT